MDNKMTTIAKTLGLALMCAMSFSAYAESDDFQSQDPWQGINRKVFAFNDTLDRYVLKPAAQGYEKVLPDYVEQRVSNVFANLGEIGNVINDLLQGKIGQAGNDSGRFLLNTTVGLAGMYDVAKTVGLPKSEGEDFGQTLNAWGVGEGPYLVLPFLGPSTVTAAAGGLVDSSLDPIRYIDHVPTRNTTYGVDLLDTRATLLEAEKLISGDKYTFTRDAYLQRRDYLINDGEVQDNFGGGDEDF